MEEIKYGKGMNPNSKKNLKPFEKGNQISKGHGRPKGAESSSTRLKRLLGVIQYTENPLTGRFENLSIAEQMDLAIAIKALNGDVKSYAELLDRFEGKATQKIQQETTLKSVVIDTTGDGETIEINPNKDDKEDEENQYFLENEKDDEDEN
jgi:hypothetical protein